MKNREKQYIVLELVDEIPMTKTETEVFIIDQTDSFIDIEREAILIERFAGTSFFRAPASLFFTDEALHGKEAE